MRHLLAGLLIALALQPVRADAQTLSADEESYIRANTIFFIYHELGHALIDLLRLPVFGQEEDAADVLGVILSETINSEDDNSAIILATADSFAYMAETAETEGYELPFWDTHGLDAQRFYTILCLHYGADPAARQRDADEFGLPEERQVTCAEEFRLADESWGPVLDDITRNRDGRDWLHFSQSGSADSPGEQIVLETLREEAAILNELLDPGLDLDITFDRCDEANAWYEPGAKRITICAELAELFLE
ncbi:MAG: DUF4344 domain-containing metallopeptidase [Rhodobacteraceae bacterium]|nr:DUF4344 domain-containing metallopeptidase [Paracoccaceae bacterium]